MNLASCDTLISVFSEVKQFPNRESRTISLTSSFAGIWDRTDRLLLTSLFAARHALRLAEAAHVNSRGCCVCDELEGKTVALENYFAFICGAAAPLVHPGLYRQMGKEWALDDGWKWSADRVEAAAVRAARKVAG
jgi:hypothetical protein